MFKRDPVAFLSLILSSVGAASSYLLARGFDPAAGMGMLVSQALIAGATLLTIAGWNRYSWKVKRSHIAPIMFNGFGAPMILFLVWRGAMVVTPALGAIIVISNAIMIAVITWALGRKQFAITQVAALATGFCGVVWISVERGALGGEGSGIASLIGGAILIALITVAMERPAMEAGALTVTRWSMWIASAVSLVILFATGGAHFYSFSQTGLAIALGIISISMPILLFNIGMSRIGAADAAVFKLLIPFFALLYGAVILKEIPSGNSILAGLVVIVSLAAYQYGGARNLGAPAVEFEGNKET